MKVPPVEQDRFMRGFRELARNFQTYKNCRSGDLEQFMERVMEEAQRRSVRVDAGAFRCDNHLKTDLTTFMNRTFKSFERLQDAGNLTNQYRADNVTVDVQSQLACGAYGCVQVVSLAENDGEEYYVMKHPLYQSHGTPYSAEEIAHTDADFTREALIHMFLDAFQQKMWLMDDRNPPMVPMIEFIGKFSNFPNGFERRDTPVLGMQRVDGTLNDLLIRNFDAYVDEDRDREFFGCIIQVANILHILHSAGKFVHRDLHLGNVMFIDMGWNEELYMQVIDTTITTRFRFVITDFGMACLKTAEDSQLFPTQDTELFSHVDPTGMYPHQPEVLDCANRAHDLRQFLHSFYYLLNPDPRTQPLRFFTEMQMQLPTSNEELHALYANREADQKFYPEYVAATAFRVLNSGDDMDYDLSPPAAHLLPENAQSSSPPLPSPPPARGDPVIDLTGDVGSLSTLSVTASDVPRFSDSDWEYLMQSPDAQGSLTP